jgi:hypothetical protein
MYYDDDVFFWLLLSTYLMTEEWLADNSYSLSISLLSPQQIIFTQQWLFAIGDCWSDDFALVGDMATSLRYLSLTHGGLDTRHVGRGQGDVAHPAVGIVRLVRLGNA